MTNPIATSGSSTTALPSISRSCPPMWRCEPRPAWASSSAWVRKPRRRSEDHMRVRQGNAPHLFEVESETDPEKWYQVFANGTVIKCTCKGYLSHKTCKHLGEVQEYLQHTEGGIEEEETGVPLHGTPGLSKWITKIHGKEFIQYAGLLAMAHEQGLIELAAEFISVTPELALAAAHAFFADG